MTKKEIENLLLAALAGTVVVIGVTILIYGTFFQDFLERFDELTSEQTDMISRDDPNYVWFIVANFAHGLLIATVLRWGKFFTPLRGAGAAATVAFLTEVYFLFTQHMLFKTMSLESAVLDTGMWTFINVFVGAAVAWTLARSVKEPASRE